VVFLQRAELDLKASAQLVGAAKVGMIHLAHAQLRFLGISSNQHGQRFVLPDARQKKHVMNLDIQPREIIVGKQPTPVTLTLDIGEDYHLNANTVAGNLVPTQLILEEGDNIAMEVAYPAGKQMAYPYADVPLQVYTGKVEIPIMIRATGPVKQLPKLFLEYQMCTDSSCLQKQKLELPVDFVLE
jgi:hypothetical protein